ncbi:Sec63 Brl domain-containing protein [Suillus lakei]|nr:Sec63 Brl domain-containing protein [Suillus lakei]
MRWLQLDKGKRKRDKTEEERQRNEPRAFKRPAFANGHLQSQITDAVRVVSETLASHPPSNSLPDPSITLNLGMIAAYYNISYITVEVYTLLLKERTKLKGLLEVVASSVEFELIPIRRHDLRRICVPIKLDRADFEAPHFKTFLLLQAHFSRVYDAVAQRIPLFGIFCKTYHLAR